MKIHKKEIIACTSALASLILLAYLIYEKNSSPPFSSDPTQYLVDETTKGFDTFSSNDIDSFLANSQEIKSMTDTIIPKDDLTVITFGTAIDSNEALLKVDNFIKQMQTEQRVTKVRPALLAFYHPSLENAFEDGVAICAIDSLDRELVEDCNHSYDFTGTIMPSGHKVPKAKRGFGWYSQGECITLRDHNFHAFE